MKSSVIITAISMIWITGHSQSATPVTSGSVTYEEKMKIEIKLEGESAAYGDMLPKERTEKKILWFSPEASLYKSEIGKESEEITEQEGTTMVMHIVSSDDRVYRDLVANTRIEQRDFMSRMFLVSSDGGKADWKLTGGQKTILGYPCQEATREEEGRKIRAWFAPGIPVSTGPQSYGNLPGLILAVDVNDGQRTITATSVDPGPADKSVLVKPKEGKKVTADQYKAIVDEKMKEMGAETGSGEHVVIKIQR